MLLSVAVIRALGHWPTCSRGRRHEKILHRRGAHAAVCRIGRIRSRTRRSGCPGGVVGSGGLGADRCGGRRRGRLHRRTFNRSLLENEPFRTARSTAIDEVVREAGRAKDSAGRPEAHSNVDAFAGIFRARHTTGRLIGSSGDATAARSRLRISDPGEASTIH